MSHYDLVIKNGNLVSTCGGVMKTDIGIRAGKILCLCNDIDGECINTIDADGKYVFPGLVDPHVHIGLRLPWNEDLNRDSRAAAAGGVTTMITTFANLDQLKDFTQSKANSSNVNNRVTEYKEILPYLEREFKGISHVDFALHLILNTKEHIDEIELTNKKFGIGSFKVFTAYKDTSELTGIDDGLVFYFLRTISEIVPNPIPLIHCEDHEIIEIATSEVKKTEMQGLVAWNAARPAIAEEVAIAKVCILARRTGSPVYIVHVSTKEGVEIIEKEQKRGTRVIAETCVHYLLLSEDIGGVCGKINPPIRNNIDRNALWEGIRRGVITCVGTDHVSRDMAGPKIGDIWTVPPGWPSMEILLPLMITEAEKRDIPITTIAEVCSMNPSKVFGLFPRKGYIGVGSDADFVIVNLSRTQKVNPAEFYATGKYSPYEGMVLKGWPEITVLRGEIIFNEGEFLDPHGEYIKINS